MKGQKIEILHSFNWKFRADAVNTSSSATSPTQMAQPEVLGSSSLCPRSSIWDLPTDLKVNTQLKKVDGDTPLSSKGGEVKRKGGEAPVQIRPSAKRLKEEEYKPSKPVEFDGPASNKLRDRTNDALDNCSDLTGLIEALSPPDSPLWFSSAISPADLLWEPLWPNNSICSPTLSPSAVEGVRAEKGWPQNCKSGLVLTDIQVQKCTNDEACTSGDQKSNFSNINSPTGVESPVATLVHQGSVVDVEAIALDPPGKDSGVFVSSSQVGLKQLPEPLVPEVRSKLHTGLGRISHHKPVMQKKGPKNNRFQKLKKEVLKGMRGRLVPATSLKTVFALQQSSLQPAGLAKDREVLAKQQSFHQRSSQQLVNVQKQNGRVSTSALKSRGDTGILFDSQPSQTIMSEADARAKVTRALEAFKEYFRQYYAEALARKFAVSGKGGDPSESSKRHRHDIRAYNRMKETGECVNTEVIVGTVPGVHVGDSFKFRHEMAVVGLHNFPNSGIAYGCARRYASQVVATCVVLCSNSSYVDNIDNGTTVQYTGHGGRLSRVAGAPVVQDQKTEKGNKAMCHTSELNLVVRLVRRHVILMNSKTKKTTIRYTYDGLYRIVRKEYGSGLNHAKVFKFILEREEGQSPIPPCMKGCTQHPWNVGGGGNTLNHNDRQKDNVVSMIEKVTPKGAESER